MTLLDKESDKSKINWQDLAPNPTALAEALSHLNRRDIRRLKRRDPDLAQLIGRLAVSAGLVDPFHPTSVAE